MEPLECDDVDEPDGLVLPQPVEPHYPRRDVPHLIGLELTLNIEFGTCTYVNLVPWNVIVYYVNFVLCGHL